MNYKYLFLTLPFLILTSLIQAQTTLYISSTGGSFPNEIWLEVTTLPNGSGTQIWGQGNGTYGNGAGAITDITFTINCGTTYYVNAYDRYADSWNGATYEIWTGPGKTGTLLANNGGAVPDDGTNLDATSAFGDTKAQELEVSEAFTYICPCTAPSATYSTVADCGNAQFSIDVNVSNLGDGTGVNISDGTTTFHTNVGTGTHNIGPFPYNTNVIVTVDGTPHGGCSSTSGSLTENCACTTPATATVSTNNLNCTNSTYDVEVTVTNFGDGTGSDIYINNSLVQSNAALSNLYTFSGYSTGNNTVEVRATGSGFVTCQNSYIVNATCNGTDAWSTAAPNILGNCSTGDLSVATIDGPTDFGPFCWNGGVSGFGLNALRNCTQTFDNTTDYTDIWYQVDIPDGSDEMTLEVTGLGANEYVAYTIHTNGPLTSSSDFVVNANNNEECSFFSQTVTSHTITGLSAYSTAPIYIRILAADPNQNLPCGSFNHPTFTICASAPQANDDCNSAIDITTNNGGTANTATLNTANDEGIACIGGVTGRDLWYDVSNILSSAPNYNGPYTVQFTADGQTGEQMIVQLIDGCYNCGSITVLGQDTLTFASPDSTDFGGFTLSGGVSNYKIRVVEFGGTTTTFTASAKLKVVNDNCEYFNSPVTGFRLWDGSNAMTRNVNMDFATNNDLFYNFTSQSAVPVYSGSVNFNISGLGANESVSIEVYERTPLYSTDCNNLTLVGSALAVSSDGTVSYDCLNELEGDYLVRVVNTGTSNAIFTLSAEPSSPAPINDKCSNIWDGSSVTFNGSAFDLTGTTVNASFANARDCENLSSLCGGVDLTASKDLWFHFTIPADNCPSITSSSKITDVTITYDAGNAFRDAYVFVYSDCNAANQLDCSGSLDGAGGSFNVSGLSTGQTYLVRVKPSSLNSNIDYSFDLSATLGPVRPCNDRSSEVQALGNVLASGFDRTTCLNGPFSAQGATSSSNPASGSDVWLSFIAPNPANGQSYQTPMSYLTIYLQSLSGAGNPYPLNIRVYEEVGLNNAIGVPLGENAVGGGSSTVSTNTNGDAWLSLGHLTPGEDYFIRISHTQPETEEVLYNLCMYETASQDICNLSSISIGEGIECSDDCSKYFRIVLPDNTPSGFFRFDAIGNNGVEVNMRMFHQPNETLGTNNGDITDVDQACGVQTLVAKTAQGALPDPGSCNGGSGSYGVFNLIGGSPSNANLYYLHVYDENNLLGCNGLDICQINVSGPYTTNALAQAGGIPDGTCAVASLPIQLLSFKGTNQGNQNEITWVTASEQNNDYFILERSRDGLTFEEFATVDGHGTTTQQQHYAIRDYGIYPTTYYRLTQVDLDGKRHQSHTIAVQAPIQSSISLSPNPATNQLSVSGIKDAVQTVVIIDGLGRVRTLPIVDNNGLLKLDVSDLPEGIYTLQIQTSRAQLQEQFIKSR